MGGRETRVLLLLQPLTDRMTLETVTVCFCFLVCKTEAFGSHKLAFACPSTSNI